LKLDAEKLLQVAVVADAVELQLPQIAMLAMNHVVQYAQQ
jgi:hypothetical protein